MPEDSPEKLYNVVISTSGFLEKEDFRDLKEKITHYLRENTHYIHECCSKMKIVDDWGFSQSCNIYLEKGVMIRVNMRERERILQSNKVKSLGLLEICMTSDTIPLDDLIAKFVEIGNGKLYKK